MENNQPIHLTFKFGDARSISGSGGEMMLNLHCATAAETRSILDDLARLGVIPPFVPGSLAQWGAKALTAADGPWEAPANEEPAAAPARSPGRTGWPSQAPSAREEAEAREARRRTPPADGFECPEHGEPMIPSKYSTGYYCPRTSENTGSGFCGWTAKAGKLRGPRAVAGVAS